MVLFNSYWLLPWRDGIRPARMPWPAPHDSPQGEPGALERSVYLDRFAGVAGTGRIKAAVLPEKRGEQQAIGIDQTQQYPSHPGQYTSGP